MKGFALHFLGTFSSPARPESTAAKKSISEMKINRGLSHSEHTMLPRGVHLFVAIDAQSN
jgi:hypothetical protein